jgi:Phage integrase SAM-like domain
LTKSGVGVEKVHFPHNSQNGGIENVQKNRESRLWSILRRFYFSELFLREYDIITQGQRSKLYVQGQHWRSQIHLVPFFGPLGLSEVTARKIQDYRIHRHEQAMAKYGKPPAHNTMHQEFVALRQTLKTAVRHGWIDHLPDLSEPYRSNPKISHRAWFSPEEYKKLYEATRKRAHEPKQARFKWECEQLHSSELVGTEIVCSADGLYCVSGVYRNEPRFQVRDSSPIHYGAVWLKIIDEPPKKVLGLNGDVQGFSVSILASEDGKLFASQIISYEYYPARKRPFASDAENHER